MKRVSKLLGLVISIILGLCALGIVLALIKYDRTFPIPLPTLAMHSDSATIIRGSYLVYGPAHCADCHASPEERTKVDSGLETLLAGGHTIETFVGTIHAPNLTSDSLTGIGAISDQALARFFKTGIDHRGQLGLPMMMYADLSNPDLIAVLSFLRTLKPVFHFVPQSEYNILGKITKAFFLEPFSPKTDPPMAPIQSMTVAYGEYLVNTVANCASCHTARNMKTGEYTGPRLAGGMIFHSSNPKGLAVISPNLTPDRETGRITSWTQEAFTKRMKQGNITTWSPMPWGPFSRMTEEDIGAIYLYLMQLKPIYRVNVLTSEENS